MENGKRQMKAPTKGEMQAKVAKLEAENKALRYSIKNSEVFVPMDENTKIFQNNQGITIIIGDRHAVLRGFTSRKVFNRIEDKRDLGVYAALYTYVDIMLNKGDEDFTDAEKDVIGRVETFIHLSFSTDSNILNPAVATADALIDISKTITILETPKGQPLLVNKLIEGIAAGMICFNFIRKDGESIGLKERFEFKRYLNDRISACVGEIIAEKLDEYVFDESIIIEPTPITEAEAMSEMMFDEQLKKEITEEI